MKNDDLFERQRKPIQPLPTVAELIKLPQFIGAQLRAARDTAAERLVGGTSVQEVPVQEFVRSHELVMTTGIGMGRDPTQFVAFVEAVATSGAAALAVAIGPHVNQIPDVVIERAEAIRLPLIEFPWELRFSEVTGIVLDRVIEHQSDLIRRSERIHEFLTKVVLGGASLHDLAMSVSRLTGLSLTIENRWGERTGNAGFDRPPRTNTLAVPILAGERGLGQLLMDGMGRELSDFERVALNHGATAAALILLIEEAKDEARMRDAAEFVSAVLNRWADSSAELQHWSHRLSIDHTGSFAVALASVKWPRKEWDERASAVGRWAFDRALGARRIPSLAMWQGSDVTLLVPCERNADAVIRALAMDVSNLLRRHERRAHVAWGIGRIANGLEEVAERYHDAHIANRLGRPSNAGDSITNYVQLGALPSLFEAISSEEVGRALQELEARYLEPLLDCERKTGVDLVRTLRVYFAQNCNVSGAARVLRLNRQSMIYRLSKIEKLLGLGLHDADARFALDLALRTRELKVQTLGPDDDRD